MNTEHLWCAQALASVLASHELAIKDFNDDIQSALRMLLLREVERAHKAAEAGA